MRERQKEEHFAYNRMAKSVDNAILVQIKDNSYINKIVQIFRLSSEFKLSFRIMLDPQIVKLREPYKILKYIYRTFSTFFQFENASFSNL